MVPEKSASETSFSDEERPTGVLSEALAKTTWRTEEGRYALIGFPEGPRAEDLALLGRAPAKVIREEEGTTLLVAEDALEAVLERHPDSRVERNLIWIRFSVAMDWELVGFLAHVTTALAAADVPVGCVCSFDRDHLFVAEPHFESAKEVLDEIFPANGGRR